MSFSSSYSQALCSRPPTDSLSSPRQNNPCATYCDNIASVTTCASTEVGCLCNPYLLSGSACSSCLATIDANPTLAASVGSAYTECAAPILCTTQCSNVLFVACTGAQCCTSVSDCSVCLTTEGGPLFATILVGEYSDCTLTSSPSVPTTTLPQTSKAPSIISETTIPSHTISTSSQTIVTPSQTSSTVTAQPKSDAHGIATEIFQGYIQFLVFIMFIMGVFGAFI